MLQKVETIHFSCCALQIDIATTEALRMAQKVDPKDSEL